MAFSFRASKSFGPVRINFSKSGIGGSIGMRGLRMGVNSKGQSYTTVSLPNTGIYATQTFGKSTSQIDLEYLKEKYINTLGFNYNPDTYNVKESFGCSLVALWSMGLFSLLIVTPSWGYVIGFIFLATFLGAAYYQQRRQKRQNKLFTRAFEDASMRKYNSAIQNLNKYEHLDVKNIDVLELTGICYYQIQEFEKARVHFENSLSIKPDNDRLLRFLADCLSRIANKDDYPKLIEIYQRLNKTEPDCDEYKLLLAYYQYLGKDFKNSISTFQKIKEGSDLYLKSLWGVASCFYEMEEYDKGIETLKIAPLNKKVLGEDLKEIHYGLGNLYAIKGDVQSAIKQFERIEIQDYAYKDIQIKIESLKNNQLKNNIN